MARKRTKAPRDGIGFVDAMLTATVVAVAVIVAAYVYLPEVQRGVRRIAEDIEVRLVRSRAGK